LKFGDSNICKNKNQKQDFENNFLSISFGEQQPSENGKINLALEEA
jgi:hypothetical protein